MKARFIGFVGVLLLAQFACGGVNEKPPADARIDAPAVDAPNNSSECTFDFSTFDSTCVFAP
jgi:hypothetical protein